MEMSSHLVGCVGVAGTFVVSAALLAAAMIYSVVFVRDSRYCQEDNHRDSSLQFINIFVSVNYLGSERGYFRNSILRRILRQTRLEKIEFPPSPSPSAECEEDETRKAGGCLGGGGLRVLLSPQNVVEGVKATFKKRPSNDRAKILLLESSSRKQLWDWLNKFHSNDQI